MTLRIPGWMLRQEAEVTPYLGSTAYESIYGDPYTLRCRVEHGNRLVRDRNGSEVVSSATLYAAPEATLSVIDIVTVDGVPHDVIDVQPQIGPTGRVHHIEVLLA